MTNPVADLRAEVVANPRWYHTMELAPGVVTPGWFDLRPILDRLPWPDVAGKRCLDIGTYDGHLAFEMERRGAAEVVALDIASHADWDWPPRDRARGTAYLEAVSGVKGRGFEIAKEALGSAVERRFLSVYDLDPDEIGRFDVVVCGSLLLHLQDPFRALDAIRGVCSGTFLSVEAIDVRLTLTSPRWPVARVSGRNGQWTIPNVAGHVRMLDIAGFDLVRRTRAFSTPHGRGHEHRRRLRDWVRSIPEIAYLRGAGIPTHAVLSRPGI